MLVKIFTRRGQIWWRRIPSAAVGPKECRWKRISLAVVTEDYDKSDAIIPMMMATLWAVEALDAKRADLVGRARAKI